MCLFHEFRRNKLRIPRSFPILSESVYGLVNHMRDSSSTGILMISTVTSSMHCFCKVMTSRPGDLNPCFEGYGKMGLWDMSLIQEGAAPYGVPGAWVLMIIPRKLTSEPPTPKTPKTCVVSRTIVDENAPDRWIVSV